MMKRLMSGHSPQYVVCPSKRHRNSELSVRSKIVGAHCDQLSTASRFDSTMKADFRSNEVPTGSSFSCFQPGRSQSQHPSGESGSLELSASIHDRSYNKLPTSSDLSCFQSARSQPLHPTRESGSLELSASAHDQAYHKIHVNSGQHLNSHGYFNPFPRPEHCHRPPLLSHGPWEHRRFSYSR